MTKTERNIDMHGVDSTQSDSETSRVTEKWPSSWKNPQQFPMKYTYTLFR